MLSTLTLAREGHYAQSFQSAHPFRHVVIDDYLDSLVCRSLLDDFPAFESRFALNEMGEPGGKAVRTQVRDLSEAYCRLDDLIRSDTFLQHISRITGIPDLLYDPDYEGGGTHENRHGQSLAAHVDFNYHPRTGWHRRLNLIIYLNEAWETCWGGSLELHADPWDVEGNKTQAVLPLFNRCVIFETNEISWHGFSRIDLPAQQQKTSRKSFAIYLYTRERPAAETAAPHATVYVPDGMPPGLSPGTVLDQRQLDDLRGRFAGLRGQLRFLYERERQFTAHIARLESALVETRAALRPEVEGYARVSCTHGYWPDGWCARDVGFELTPSRPVREVELELWAPADVAGGQQLAIQIADQRFDARISPGTSSRLRWKVRLQPGAASTLSIKASSSWRPASDGSASDERELAFKLQAIRLLH